MTAATEPPTDWEPRRIHLYRPQNQLGDLLLTVPAIRAIRDRFGSARITLIVGSQNAAAVAGQPWADEIRIVPSRNLFGILRVALAPGPRPDLAVYFTTVSYSKGGAYLVRASGARERIGFDPARYGEGDRAGLTRPLPYPERPLHQAEVSMILAAAVGAGPAPPPPYYLPDPSLVSDAPKDTVYLHPGAGKAKNRWPAAGFAAVAGELLARGHDTQWIEGPQDHGCVDAATRCLGRSLPVVRGEPIPRLAARFARASLYIGNDTGPLHLAAATGCPTVGLYGWSDPAEWSAVGRCVRSLRAADHLLESIQPRQVLETALPLLEEERCAIA